MENDKVPVSGNAIKTQGHIIANKRNIDTTQLNFSNGWLRSFKARNGFRSYVTHGEAGSVVISEQSVKAFINQFQQKFVVTMKEIYLTSMKQVYNMHKLQEKLYHVARFLD